MSVDQRPPVSSATDFDSDALREKYRLERDKRIRADGNAEYVEMAGSFADYLQDPYIAGSNERRCATTSPSPSSAAGSRASSPRPA